ncbi:mobilization protein [Acidiphilium acidophilum]|uniref:mobilization protein n=1 Tax=Acidiphilium acidophilum TaxID=76588 RepID=UPI002E8E77B1|nr:mobilization protein [Acidiphilium acidophilum]
MARLPIEQQIAQLEERTKALKARMAKQDRARDTRRKILLGSLVLHRLEQNGDGEFSKRLGDWLKRELPGFLTREEDKTLLADLLTVKGDLLIPAPVAIAEPARPELNLSDQTA